MRNEKGLSIILLNWNTRDLLKGCLESLYRTTKGLSCEVIVADNGSTDGSLDMVRKGFPGVRVIEHGENLGFTRGYNQVLREINTPYVLLLNTDTVLLEGAVEGMLNFLKERPDVGIVAPQYLNADGTKQNSIANFPTLATELLNRSLLRLLLPGWYPGKRQDYTEPLEVESVVGAAPMLRQEAFREVGFFDEDYFAFLEETDLCFRLRKAGWRCFHLPALKVHHLGGGASKKKIRLETTIEYYCSLYKFFRKHRGAFSYWTLRVFRPIKILINLFLLVLGLLTLFMNERIRSRFFVNLRLLEWHLRGCPEGMGLRKEAGAGRS